MYGLIFRSVNNIRRISNASAGSTSRIHQYADSQFGHIFATCHDRESARIALILSLRSLIVRGEICTNVEALQKILESPGYISNKTSTDWLESHMRFSSPAPAQQFLGTSMLSAIAFAAVYKASCHFADEEALFISRLSQGQIPQSVPVIYSTEMVYKDTTKFAVECMLKAPNEIRVRMNGSHVDCQFNKILPGAVENQGTTTSRPRADTGWYLINGGLDGKHHRVCFREDRRQNSIRVTVNSATYCFTKEKDPTQVSEFLGRSLVSQKIRAPFSGKLVRWIAPPFSQVQLGSPYAEIEIMKMYVQLTCDGPGIINHVLVIVCRR